MIMRTEKRPVVDYFTGTTETDRDCTPYGAGTGLLIKNDAAVDGEVIVVSLTAKADIPAFSLKGGETFDQDFNEFTAINIAPTNIGTKQVETIAVTAGATASGDTTWAVTAAGMTNSPKDVVVAVTTDDDQVGEVAAKVRAALAADEDVSDFFTVSGSGANIVITAKDEAANDGTMAIALTAGATGVTVGASANTTAGVAPTAIAYRAWVRS
jgi:hypothetical protein